MVNRAKGISVSCLFFLLLALLLPGSSAAFERKMKVVADYAHVYLQPDESSPVIDTLERGSVLSLLYSGKMKKIWYYVCFRSEKTGNTKSGYVLDSMVEPLFDALNSVVIREQNEDLRVKYAPRKFEEMQWGLSKKQIVEMEGKPSSQQKHKGLEVLTYDQQIINMDCSVSYVFAANKLSRTLFSFRNDYLEKNDCLEDYRRVKDALIQKYGRPLEESMNWKDASFKDDFSSWGDAVSLGQLELYSRWETQNTEISAKLTGAASEVSLTVDYRGHEMKELAKRQEEQN